MESGIGIGIQYDRAADFNREASSSVALSMFKGNLKQIDEDLETHIHLKLDIFTPSKSERASLTSYVMYRFRVSVEIIFPLAPSLFYTFFIKIYNSISNK